MSLSEEQSTLDGNKATCVQTHHRSRLKIARTIKEEIDVFFMAIKTMVI